MARRYLFCKKSHALLAVNVCFIIQILASYNQKIFRPCCNLFASPPVILTENLASTSSSLPFIRAGRVWNEPRSLALV